MLIPATMANDGITTAVLAWAVGWQEILVIVVVVLILFGGRKIPELAKGLGKGLREFKREMSGIKKDFEESTAEPDDDDAYEPPRRKKVRRRPPSEADLTGQGEKVAHSSKAKDESRDESDDRA